MPRRLKPNPERLLDRAADALRKDLQHIMNQVEQGKLPDKAARDLVNYVKVLSDIVEDKKKREKEKLKEKEKLTDEEIKAMLKDIEKSE